MSTTTIEPDAETGGGDKLFDNPTYKGYVVAVLVLGYIFNTVDRGAINILVEPIKQEFGVSDFLMGLLTGTAFAVFYAVMGIPIARLADRWSRVNVLTLSIALWRAAGSIGLTR